MSSVCMNGIHRWERTCIVRILSLWHLQRFLWATSGPIHTNTHIHTYIHTYPYTFSLYSYKDSFKNIRMNSHRSHSKYRSQKGVKRRNNIAAAKYKQNIIFSDGGVWPDLWWWTRQPRRDHTGENGRQKLRQVKLQMRFGILQQLCNTPTYKRVRLSCLSQNSS